MARKGNGLRPGQIEKMLSDRIGDINKRFHKELKRINIAGIIKGMILKGISPVFGVAARFKQYSQSYIDVIQGKARYFSFKSGKVVRVEAPEYTQIRVTKKGVKQGKTKQLLFEKGLGVGKKVSPVNLKKSGEMLDTLTYNEKTGELIADHERWQYHNGTDSERKDTMPERRLLPNRPGERFNRRIEQNITEALVASLGLDAKASRKVKRFMGVKFNIR